MNHIYYSAYKNTSAILVQLNDNYYLAKAGMNHRSSKTEIITYNFKVKGECVKKQQKLKFIHKNIKSL